jgi:hypothetical protein
MEYCALPRVEKKIPREFATESGVLVKESVRSLVKRGRLRCGNKGVKIHYQVAA